MADVLVIDDDIDSAEVLAEIMNDSGHEVCVGYNGQDGLRLAAERLPELALLDVEMPVLDGPGMAYEMFIHDMGMELVPLILLSGVPELDAIAADVGTPYYLAKPYRYEQLLAMVKRALAERTPPTPRPRA